MSIQDLLSTQTLNLPVSSEEIELTQEEIDTAIQKAKVIKSIAIDDERKKRLTADARLLNDAPWTPNQFWEYCKRRADDIVRHETGDHTKKFEMVPWQKPVIKALCYYFTNNPEFEKLDSSLYNDSGLPFSLNKGIYLFSPPGCGKTTIMDMFRINKRQCYGLVQCAKLVYQFTKEGEGMLKPHCQEVENGSIFPSTPFSQKVVGICYNDLGTELIPALSYGNKVNVMEQILITTYDRKVPFWHRHITTNLTTDQVENVYGVRVKDRMRQMFNIIDIKGESLRK